MSVIDTTSLQKIGSDLVVGIAPFGVEISPDGAHAYVTRGLDKVVSVIDTGTNQITGADIGVGDRPRGVAITPDGSRAYVTNNADNSVSVISLQPSPPRSVTATAGDALLTTSWEAPAFNGGQPIALYTATVFPGGQSCATDGPRHARSSV